MSSHTRTVQPESTVKKRVRKCESAKVCVLESSGCRREMRWCSVGVHREFLRIEALESFMHRSINSLHVQPPSKGDMLDNIYKSTGASLGPMDTSIHAFMSTGTIVRSWMYD